VGLSARLTEPAAVDDLVGDLLGARRAFEARVGGEPCLVASQDAGRVRDALGTSVPLGLPAVYTEPVEHPLRDLVARHGRTHGPFTVASVATRFGVSVESVRGALSSLEDQGRVVAGEFTPGGREREFCDADVLRQLRRRSLASLRREVEPVASEALARFLPAWQGVGGGHRGPDGVAEAVGVLQGAALVASTLDADVLGTRVADYRPADLDLLCSSGEVVWVGAGGLGAHDGRVRLAFRDSVAALVHAAVDGLPDGPHHDVIRGCLTGGGASFWVELVAAVSSAGLPTDDATVLEALWDLVWSGEVTNDTLSPLRAKVAGGLKRRASGSRSRRAPDLRGLARSGPPSAAGRWSLTSGFLADRPAPTEVTTARALQLLERYGVLTREMALAEGIEGGFAGVYPVLKVLEERGQVRRGYFVEGLGAAQFATPGAVDRLRAEGHRGRESSSTADRLPWEARPEPAGEPVVRVLAATDPAQPFGAALAWPPSTASPSRSAGAYVVTVDGVACAHLERGGRRLTTFPGAEQHPSWVTGLAELVGSGRVRRLRVEHLNGERAAASPLAAVLRDAGFSDGYKGLTLGA